MAKIKEYQITIEGFNPMLMNRLSRELNKEIKKVPKAQMEEWEEQNYEKKLYKDQDGNVRVPEINVLSFLQECSKKYQVSPPKQVGRTWTNYIKGAIIVKEVSPMEYSKIVPLGVMVNGNPSTSKGSSKVYKVRPLIHDWKFTFTIQDSAGFLDKDTISEIVSNGGLLVGFGDWRPQYGRYRVVNIKSSEVTL